MKSDFEFAPGDIIELAGECYQVLEDLGGKGQVRNFPSEETEGFELAWEDEGAVARRIGQAPLPAPSPCATGGSCPSYEIKPPRREDAGIIARSS